MRRYEYVEGTSSKFWQVETKGKEVIVTYGRIGTDGQTKTKSHASPAAAEAEANKLADKKVAKGYVKVAAGAAKKAAKKTPKKKPAKKAAKKKKPAKAKEFSPIALKRIFKAIGRGSTKELQSALDKGLDPNTKEPSEWSDMPLLHFALRNEQAAAASLLIDHGAKLSLGDSYENTPLHYAVGEEAVAGLVPRMLEAGADVNARTKGGQTPLFKSIPSVMRTLVDAGADLEAKDKEGLTAYGNADTSQRAMLRELGAQGFSGPGGRLLKPKTKKNPKLEEIHRTECIGKADDGAIWLGSYAGYHRFGEDGVTQYTFDDSFSPDGFAAGKDGAIYFSTNWGLLELKDEVWTLYQPSNCEIHDGHIVEIAADGGGRIHCTAYNKPYVSVFDGRSWSILEPGKDLPEDFEIKCMAFDDDDNMLLGSDDDGARRKVDGAWEEVELHDKSLGTPTVYCFANMDGAVWVGCLNGIMRVADGEATHYEPDGVSLITGLAPAGDGLMWASGNYDGLVKLEDGELSYYREEDHELLDGSVEGLVVDDNGLLWIHDGNTVLTFDGTEVKKAGGKTFAESHPELAAKRAKRKAKAAAKKAVEKRSKHVKG